VGGVERGPGHERIRKRAGIFSGERLDDLEKHDVRRHDFAAACVGSGRVIDEGEVLSFVLREIDNEVEAFAWREDQVMHA
jgi:hypothetical protein